MPSGIADGHIEILQWARTVAKIHVLVRTRVVRVLADTGAQWPMHEPLVARWSSARPCAPVLLFLLLLDFLLPTWPAFDLSSLNSSLWSSVCSSDSASACWSMYDVWLALLTPLLPDYQCMTAADSWLWSWLSLLPSLIRYFWGTPAQQCILLISCHPADISSSPQAVAAGNPCFFEHSTPCYHHHLAAKEALSALRPPTRYVTVPYNTSL